MKCTYFYFHLLVEKIANSENNFYLIQHNKSTYQIEKKLLFAIVGNFPVKKEYVFCYQIYLLITVEFCEFFPICGI